MTTKICTNCNKELNLTSFAIFQRSDRKKPSRKSICKSCCSIKRKEYYQKNPEKNRLATKKWRTNNTEYNRKRQRDRHKELREDVLEYYGNICVCCGESFPPFLAIDHIGGGGNEHRRRIGTKNGGAGFYKWIIDNNYPNELRILCHNCNMAITWYNNDLELLKTELTNWKLHAQTRNVRPERD